MSPKTCLLRLGVLLVAWNIPRIESVTEKSHIENAYNRQPSSEKKIKFQPEGDTSNATVSSLELLNNSAEIEDIDENHGSDQLDSSGHYSDKLNDRTEKNVYQSKRDLLDHNKLLRKESSFYEEFTRIFDHFKWDPDLMIHPVPLNENCKAELSKYLTALKSGSESCSWAVKVSDASGRYRGAYLFENDFWLGSKQFCEEIGSEKSTNAEIPRLQFFVVRMLTNLIPVSNITYPLSLFSL